MQRLTDSQRTFLKEATSRYHQSLPGSLGEEYLETRGLTSPSIREQVAKFRLGYVVDPLPGHEIYKGMLAIPYLRWSQEHGWAVVSIRYRRIADSEGGGKYLTQAGDRPRLYNTLALLKNTSKIAITEGEIDAITAQVCGIPTVGVPGSQAWRDHFREPFLGYRDVFILADGDEAGLQFAHNVAKTLFNAKVIPMPTGHDVNSLVIEQGKQALLSRLR
ncbi:toprim domain-containing protein [Mycobacterium avium subsp. hominissuis]|nr:toprim domain-containing protein [Mycobacterium avium subsp. hominissuis]MCA4761930.1 toprim domain-containing protein [Mycobacterium avium subsp. hominissuis]